MKAKSLLLKHMTVYYAHNLHFLVVHLPHTGLLHSWHMSVVRFLHFEVEQVRWLFTIELAFVSLGLQTSSARRLRDTVSSLPVRSSPTLYMNSLRLILFWQTVDKIHVNYIVEYLHRPTPA